MPPSARPRILEAANELLSTVGPAGTTTKAIARAAQCSEAALYKHFRNKEELFVAVLSERLPRRLLDTVGRVPTETSVAENLTNIVLEAARFYRQSFPLAMTLYGDPALARHRREVLGHDLRGPHLPIMRLTTYLAAEKAVGRIAAHAEPHAVAALLLGACAQRAFAYAPVGDVEVPTTDEEFAAALVRTVFTGIALPDEG